MPSYEYLQYTKLKTCLLCSSVPVQDTDNVRGRLSLISSSRTYIRRDPVALPVDRLAKMLSMQVLLQYARLSEFRKFKNSGAENTYHQELQLQI